MKTEMLIVLAIVVFSISIGFIWGRSEQISNLPTKRLLVEGGFGRYNSITGDFEYLKNNCVK